MGFIIIPLILGFLISNRNWLTESQLKYADKLTTGSLFFLLLVMGTRMGADPTVLKNLGTIGLRALLIACFTIFGSIVCVWILEQVSPNFNNEDDSSTQEVAMGDDASDYKFTGMLLMAVLCGALLGYLWFTEEAIQYLEWLTTFALMLLLLGVGLELGNSQEIFDNFKKLGVKVILLPITVAVGSILGALLLVGIWDFSPWNEAAALASGFGWYSLSAVILTEVHSPTLGALSFLSNVFREVIAIIIIPIVAKLVGKLSAIAPGGATTMDVTLPMIGKASGAKFIPIAFVNGAVLSLLVPILVRFFISF